MEHTCSSDNLADEMMNAGTPAVLVCAPVGAGKTSACLNIYRQLDDDFGSRCMILSPNAPTADYLRRRLIASSETGVVIAPNIATFSAINARILATGNKPPEYLSPMKRYLLLRRIVDDLLAKGKLEVFTAIADTPGLITTLDASIAELKRAAIDPANLAQTADDAKHLPKNADLLAVYTAYQQYLNDNNLYDTEGQAWLARDLLVATPNASAESCGLGKTSMLIADGFTDFTPTQLEILRLLSARLDKTVFTLPLTNDSRTRMWRWSANTASAINDAFGERLTTLRAECPGNNSDLHDIQASLFDMQAAPIATPANLQIIEAAGMDAEVAAVARRVKLLLTQGEEPDDIAVITRSGISYDATIRRVFRHHDIPLAAKPTPLADMPIVRFAADAASLAPQFASDDVLRVLRSSYFRPESLGNFTRPTAAIAEMIIREGNVLEGRQAYATAAQRMIWSCSRATRNEDEPRTMHLGPLEVTPQSLQDAADMMDLLFAAISGDITKAAPAKPQTAILRIIDSLKLQEAACSHRAAELIARDLRAIALLTQALMQMGSGKMTPITLRQALSMVSCPPPRGESLVTVLDILSARAMRFKHVFLMGVNEGAFPSRQNDGALLGESERNIWRQSGAKLHSRGDLAAREMLLFYLAISRSDSHLTVSYQTSSNSGKPAAASGFVESLLEPMGGLDALDAAERITRIKLGTFLPPPDQLANRRDVATMAVSGWFADPERLDPRVIAWATANMRETIVRSVRGVCVRRRRWQAGECDRFDGRIDNPRLIETLLARYPGGTVFSASRLNSFACCPWQYFATYVLKLSPLPQPQRNLEATTRGEFMHEVLYRVMTALHAEIAGPVPLAGVDIEHVLQVLAAAIEAESEPYERRTPFPRLWQIQRNQMHRHVAGYLRELVACDEAKCGAQAIHFELAFGMPARNMPDDELTDAASTPDPVKLETSAGTVSLRGKIDRVDNTSASDDADVVIVDYKTGRLPRIADIVAGRNLQLPLYARAAEQLLTRKSAGGQFHRVAAGGGKLDFTSSAKGRAIKDAGGFDEAFDKAIARVGEFITQMREGRFDVTPTGDCPSYCPFKQICQFAPARKEAKAEIPAGGNSK